MTPVRGGGRLRRLIGRFARHEGGANAVEFSIMALPFLSLIFFVLQIGILTMTKMSLDAGVLKAAEDLETRFSGSSTPALPSGAALKTSVSTGSGGMVNDATKLKVEVQPMTNLTAAVVPVTDQLANYGTPRTILAVRAIYTATSFIPGISGTMTVHSSTVLRRQSQ